MAAWGLENGLLGLERGPTLISSFFKNLKGPVWPPGAQKWLKFVYFCEHLSKSIKIFEQLLKFL